MGASDILRCAKQHGSMGAAPKAPWTAATCLRLPRRSLLSRDRWSGNFLLSGWSAMPAYCRSASWMCSGRTRMPLSLSQARVCGLSGTWNCFSSVAPMTRLPLMPGAEEHDRADGPVVLAVALVVGRRAAHFALHDHDEFLADLQFLGPAEQVGDAGEELGDELHLVGVVVRVAVELADGEVRGDADAGLERGEGDLGLLRRGAPSGSWPGCKA